MTPLNIGQNSTNFAQVLKTHSELSDSSLVSKYSIVQDQDQDGLPQFRVSEKVSSTFLMFSPVTEESAKAYTTENTDFSTVVNGFNHYVDTVVVSKDLSEGQLKALRKEVYDMELSRNSTPSPIDGLAKKNQDAKFEEIKSKISLQLHQVALNDTFNTAETKSL